MSTFTPRVQHDPACATCIEVGPNAFYPPHAPSARCESGSKVHCTCGTCF